jgi:hypothetical protein
MATQNIEIGTVITNPTDNTLYDRKVVMTLPAAMGGAIQTFYMRFNDDEINIQNSEDGQYDSRTLVAYNRITDFLQVEYYSGQADGDSNTGGNQPLLYYHRLVYDKANDQGRLVNHIGQDNNSARFTLAGKPEAGGTLALSWVSDFSSTTREYQACVAAADGTIATDNSLACDVTGTDVGSLAWINTALSNAGAASWVVPADTLGLSYTVDTAFSADVAQ